MFEVIAYGAVGAFAALAFREAWPAIVRDHYRTQQILEEARQRKALREEQERGQ